MNDFTLFLGKFFRQGTAIASVAPSSRWLSETTVRNIDWGTVNALVELGAGTGPITRVIARHARPDCRVVVIERDPVFAGLLRDRFRDMPNLDILEGNVGDLDSILAGCGIDRVDHVISGLPVPSFPKELQQSLFEAVRKVLR
jgi:phospholipid N-methyltransferase